MRVGKLPSYQVAGNCCRIVGRDTKEKVTRTKTKVEPAPVASCSLQLQSGPHFLHDAANARNIIKSCNGLRMKNNAKSVDNMTIFPPPQPIPFRGVCVSVLLLFCRIM